MKTTLIADSGATKTDWAWLMPDGSVGKCRTQGLHPLFTPDEELRRVFAAVRDAVHCTGRKAVRDEAVSDLLTDLYIAHAVSGVDEDAEPTSEPTLPPTLEPTRVPTQEPTQVPIQEPTQVPIQEPTQVPAQEPALEQTPEQTQESGEQNVELHAIHYFTAGCVSKGVKDRLEGLLRGVFEPSGFEGHVRVYSDLEAAAKAAFPNSSGLLVLLGSGSICARVSCGLMVEQSASMGYAMGDEGSGADIGKRLLRGYFRGAFSSVVMDFLDDRMMDLGFTDANDRYAQWMARLYNGAEGQANSGVLAGPNAGSNTGLSTDAGVFHCNRPETGLGLSSKRGPSTLLAAFSQAVFSAIVPGSGPCPPPDSTSQSKTHLASHPVTHPASHPVTRSASRLAPRPAPGPMPYPAVAEELAGVLKEAFRDFAVHRYASLAPVSGERTVLAGGVAYHHTENVIKALSGYSDGPFELLNPVIDGLVHWYVGR